MATVTGTSGNDTLTGTSGADTIFGLDGNDKLIGGAGADSLDGGNGTDTVSYETSTSGLVIDLHNGSTSTGDASGDTYNSIERFIGSTYADTFVAGINAEGFYGNSSYYGDTVKYSNSTSGITVTFDLPNTGVTTGTGVGGFAQGDSYNDIDVIVGSSYNDVYIIGGNSAASDSLTITEGSSGGTDEVQTSFSNYYLQANIENLSYTGSSYLIGTGNNLNNVITGGNGGDRLIGAGGADTLNGGNGTDTASYETSTTGLVIDLYNGSTSTGDAVGDVYNSIERFLGSTYADTFVAGSNAEGFYGNSLYYGDTVKYSNSTSGITVTFDLPNTGVTTGTGVGGYAQGDSYNDIDVIVGSTYNDVYIIGGTSAASDSLTITEGSSGGTDEVQTTFSNYYLQANIEKLTYAGSSSFTGTGNSLANIITGGNGSDKLIGAGGADTLNGGNGTDTASYETSTVGLVIDLYNGSTSTGDAVGDVYNSVERFLGSAYADTFIASSNAEGFYGNSSYYGDTVNYSRSTSGVTLTFNLPNAGVTTGTGSGGYAQGDNYNDIDVVVGSNYDDVYIIGGDSAAPGSLTITEGSSGGTDEVRTTYSSYSLQANIENLTYTGSSYFTGTGNSLNNVITGGNGNDSLIGNDGNDTLIGGAGSDTLNGGNGTDTASYETASAAITLNFKTNVHTGHAAGDIFTSIEAYRGSAYNDSFVSGSTAQAFDGNGGTDTIDYSGSTAGVSVDLTGGATGSGGDAAGDSFTNIEVAIGSAYADTLSSARSGDTLIGGTGNDVYVIGNSGVVITEASSAGTDEVKTALASLSIASTANVENLTYTGSGNFTGTGNSLDNVLTGGSGDDVLAGGAGSDQLIGSGGSDSADYSASSAAVTVDLTAGTASGGDAAGDTYSSIEKVIGSAFDDTLSSSTSGHILAGGAGNDVYVVGNSGVTVSEAASAGADEVQTALSSLSIAGFADVENLTYTGSGNFTGTGNAGDNVITGGNGNDTLIGGAGADQLVGGNGTDVASYQNASAGVTIDLKSNTLTGDAAGDVFTSIEVYKGSTHNDTFISGSSADSFDGNSGSDTIDYSGSSAAVSVDLTAGTGSGGDAAGDSLISFEKVIGSAYNDTLGSATAGHTLQGGAGDDVYVVGNASVAVSEAASAGTDEVRTSLASLSIASIANVENLTHTGTGDFTGTGNAGDNVLTGGNGNDTLIGGAGADQLVGGNGNDVASYEPANSAISLNLVTGTHTGDAAGDTFSGIEAFKGSIYNDSFVSSSAAEGFEGQAGSADTVDYSASTAAVAVDLTAGIGIGGFAAGDTLTGIEYIVGSSHDDTLSSTAAGDSLAGGDGDDVITVGDGTATGGDGNDTLTGTDSLASLFGGDGDDILILNAGGTAYGGDGSDEYRLDSLSGTAAIQDDGASGIDKVLLPFLNSLAFSQTQVGDDLVLSDGTNTVTLTAWYNGFNTIEQFETLDNDIFAI